MSRQMYVEVLSDRETPIRHSESYIFQLLCQTGISALRTWYCVQKWKGSDGLSYGSVNADISSQKKLIAQAAINGPSEKQL